MGKRICYVHVGPPKTGTSAIQLFLKENRDALTKVGYFVPRSGTAPGGSHGPLANWLCGTPHPRHYVPKELEQEIAAAAPDAAVIISSESLNAQLGFRDVANAFFRSLAALDLKPRLLLFPRHQPQWFNAIYSQLVKSFRFAEPLPTLIVRKWVDDNYLRWIALADAHGVDLIARPYTRAARRAIVPEFLSAIGAGATCLTSSSERHNQTVGPFTIAVATRVNHELGRGLTALQAGRCKRILERYLARKALADDGYVGLTTDLARQMEADSRDNNDAFSQRLWDRPWNEVYCDDVCSDFAPNDYALAGVPPHKRVPLEQAVTRIARHAAEALKDPALAVDEPWNDPLRFFRAPADRASVAPQRQTETFPTARSF
jgi:hypothetical protein